jgi:hypothetical protein
MLVSQLRPSPAVRLDAKSSLEGLPSHPAEGWAEMLVADSGEATTLLLDARGLVVETTINPSFVAATTSCRTRPAALKYRLCLPV